MHGPRTRVLATLTFLLTAGVLTLAACNSGGVSSSSQKPSGSSNGMSAAQMPAPARASGKTTLADGLAAQLSNPR